MTTKDRDVNGKTSEDDLDGLEEEDLGDSSENPSLDKPFDPRKVDVSITTPNLGALIERLRHQEINLVPDFQRSPDLWSQQAQSRLIESILIRLPIPAFYFDALVEDKWQVVDGLQRLSAIKNFIIDKKLRLTKLEFLKEYEGNSYDDLPRSLQRRIDEFNTSVYLIKPGTPLEMKYSLFHRINTGGLKLTHQEIRHAMSQSVRKGIASKFLKEIVENEIFLRVVGSKNNRMSYQELVLRHMAFVILDEKTYKSSLPKFLDEAMIKLGELPEAKFISLRENFISALETADKLFGKDAFKKTLAEPEHKKVVNKPLFESVSVCLALIDGEKRSNIVAQKSQFRESFRTLLNDCEFSSSISRSTANTENVQTRFKMIRNLIKQFT